MANFKCDSVLPQKESGLLSAGPHGLGKVKGGGTHRAREPEQVSETGMCRVAVGSRRARGQAREALRSDDVQRAVPPAMLP